MLSSFKLTQIGDLNNSCTALYESLIDSVFELIDQADRNPEFAVHEIRKKLKMIRAFLKMVKPALAENLYELTNIHFRDIGRMLSEIRDAHSRRQLLVQFTNDYSSADLQALFNELIQINRVNVDELEKIHFFDFNIFLRIRKKLEKTDTNLSFGSDRFRLSKLIQGLSSTYESGFNAFYTSLLCNSPDLLHEWRKRVKDLQSQAHYINDIAGLSPHIEIAELHDLADQLGEIQNVNMAREWLSGLALEERMPDDMAKLDGLLKKRLEKLLKTTVYLGRSSYRLDPVRFKYQLQRLIS